MIASHDRHYESDVLRQLLDEELPADQCDLVESHLSGCANCRGHLEQLAGGQDWWNETVEILSESTVVPSEKANEPTTSLDPLDASVDWIRPLLTQAAQDGGIGCLDQYRITGVIGQGGMGVVLGADDLELNRPVAIKVLSPHLAGVGAARARFMREAQASAAIVHPNVVPIYSIVPAARLPYIVMPRIRGGNLQQRINEEGPLDLAEVLRIGIQVAEGLQAAHRNGVIHRDIKPANILIEEGNGRVLISDFGLARALDDATLTMSGMIAGTPQYMSPEQASGEPIDVRSDLFSLGSLLYALSTGRPPYRAETALAVLRKITESKPRPIHQINERIPEWFNRLIDRLMHSDLSRRFATATEVVDLLRDSYAHVRHPSAHPVPTTLRSPSHAWIRPVAAIATLVAIIAAAGFLSRTFIGLASPDRSDNVDPVVVNANARIPESPTTDDPEYDHWMDPVMQEELQSIQKHIDRMAESIQHEWTSPHEIETTEPATQPL